MQIFNKNKFFPQNFFISSNNGESLENPIERICSEAYRISPGSFNGERLYFKFILRYCPPYEQDRFQELKRLQEIARNNVRFKYEYKGYVAIDITEWIGHLDEELFERVTMAFLCDMSDCWKYIFISSKSNIAEEDMRVLNRFFKVKHLDASLTLKVEPFNQFFESIRKRFGIRFSPHATEVFRRFVPVKAVQRRETILALEGDFKNFFGKHSNINKEMIMEYFIDSDSVGHDLLSEKDIAEIYSIVGEGQRI